MLPLKTSQSSYSSLSFIVAKCSQELPYKFKFLRKGTFSQHSRHGSINVKQFSIFGLVKKLFESSLFGLASRSYFAQLFYIDDGENAWKLDFIITWNLELCLTVSNNNNIMIIPVPLAHACTCCSYIWFVVLLFCSISSKNIQLWLLKVLTQNCSLRERVFLWLFQRMVSSLKMTGPSPH